jgi:hypothetical protein
MPAAGVPIPWTGVWARLYAPPGRTNQVGRAVPDIIESRGESVGRSPTYVLSNTRVTIAPPDPLPRKDGRVPLSVFSK